MKSVHLCLSCSTLQREVPPSTTSASSPEFNGNGWHKLHGTSSYLEVPSSVLLLQEPGADEQLPAACGSLAEQHPAD